MNPFYSAMRPKPNPVNMIQQIQKFSQQIQQIKNNPSQLAEMLMKNGMINEQQAKDIVGMGGNFEEIGKYLMGNGMLPNNVEQYQGMVNQVQNMINQ